MNYLNVEKIVAKIVNYLQNTVINEGHFFIIKERY